MHLLVREAVDDVRAGALQAPGPLDVVLFVEARFEFDDDRDLLLIFGGLEKRARDRRVLPDVRYSVALIASTFSSSAACCRNWTTGSNDSYGWCSRMSPSRIAANMSVTPMRRLGIAGKNGLSRSYRSRARLTICHRSLSAIEPVDFVAVDSRQFERVEEKIAQVFAACRARFPAAPARRSGGAGVPTRSRAANRRLRLPADPSRRRA